MSHRIIAGFFSLLLVTGMNTAYAQGKPHVKKEKPVKVKKDKKHHHHRNHRWH